MPHLIIRGVSSESIRKISKQLIFDIASLCQCPQDHIILECLHTSAFYDGEQVSSYPFIEVNWFDRGQEVQDQVASCMDRHIRSLGIAEAEVAFRIYEPDRYYTNGVSLAMASTHDNQEVIALRAENENLKDELQKLRKALQASQQSSSSSQMSSRLRDALRE
ncbi:DUF1904 family protein [Cohnella sp.]|uniref:DUF1904 family protein n=1 Tax=Cohnella sp. TaxID=1883426 RepID=UPI0035641E56